jgi:hypothetical protein
VEENRCLSDLHLPWEKNGKKCRVVHVTKQLNTEPWIRMGECMHKSTLFWPRHQFEASGQLRASAALPPGEEVLVPITNKAWWAPEPILTTWKSEYFRPYQDSNSDPSVVQPVTNRYADYSAAAPVYENTISRIMIKSNCFFVFSVVIECEIM